MSLPRLLRRPLGRSAALLAIAALGVALVLAGEPTQTTDVGPWEPYPPFIMTYTAWPPHDVTIRLIWLGSRSWQTRIVESPEDDGLVGNSQAYDGATLTYATEYGGITTRYLSCDDDSYVPGPWFLPRAFRAEDGWEALGRGRDGYDHFLRVVRHGETEFRTL